MGERDILFPLVDSSCDNKEILRAISTLLSGQLTMGPQVKDFEKEFSDFLNIPYAIMMNSGSSANLLDLSVLTNPARTKQLKASSKVAIPVRDIVDAETVIECILHLACNHFKGIVNIGSGEGKRIIDIAHHIMKLANKNIQIKGINETVPDSLVADVTLLRKTLLK
ncbi:MAG: DegT/DnrJ/EryC1/StrS family aminotransferase [Planctomycetota bacterium]|jgi:hypothetical protein